MSSESNPPYGGASQGGNFGIGSVLRRTLKTLLDNPVLFFGLTILAAIPGVFIQLLSDNSVGGKALLTLVSGVCGAIVQGAIAYGVYRCLKGESAGFGDAIRRGLARFLPILGVSVIFGLGIGIGTMLLIVPGLLLACIWAVALPACVVEKLGVTDSLRRSSELTRGCRWSIFALLALLSVISAVLGLLVVVLPAALESPVFTILGVAIISIIPAAFQNVMTSVIYYDLRAVKEGVGIGNLANVFD